MAAKVFITYRREDSKYQTDRIHTAFCKAIPSDHVFMGINSIPPGINFRKLLNDWVGQCEVLLALIGPGWIDARDPKTKGRRLDNKNDFVRIEIGEALRRGIPVVPVLLDRTPMPDANLLPNDLKELVDRQAEFVEYRTFDGDVERLITRLRLNRDVAYDDRYGANTSTAQARLAALEREAAEAKAAEQRAHIAESTDKEAVEAFLEQWPNGQSAETARARIAALEREAAEAKAAEQERRTIVLRLDLKSWSYWKIAVAGAVLGLISGLMMDMGLRRIPVGDDAYLLDACNGVFAAGFSLLVVKLTAIPSIQNRIFLFLGQYILSFIQDFYSGLLRPALGLYLAAVVSMAAGYLIYWFVAAPNSIPT